MATEQQEALGDVAWVPGVPDLHVADAESWGHERRPWPRGGGSESGV